MLSKITKKNINNANGIINKLSIGFAFNSYDYCNIFAGNVLQCILNNIDKLKLINEQQEKLTELYNELIYVR